MKLKFFIISLLLFFSAQAALAQTTRKTSTPIVVNALPSPNVCNSTLDSPQLLIVKNVGTYQCLNNTYVPIQSSGGSNAGTTETLTNKTLSGSLNIFSNIPQTAITNLLTDLDSIRVSSGGSGAGFVTLANTYSNSLTTAVASVGITRRTLTIDADTQCSQAVTIPGNLILRQDSKAKIIFNSGCVLNFEGIGIENPKQAHPLFVGFAAGTVKWTGSEYPREISTELFDTGTVYLTDRLIVADAAFSSKANQAAPVYQPVKIIAYPRIIRGVFVLEKYHELYFEAGDYFNEQNTYLTDRNAILTGPNSQYEPPFLLKDYTRVSASPNARLHETTYNSSNYYFYVFDMGYGPNGRGATRQAKSYNVIIDGLTFIGTPGLQDFSPGNQLVHLGNCQDCGFVNSKVYGTHGYSVILGSGGEAGNYAFRSEVYNNLFVGVSTYNIGILNGIANWVHHNRSDLTGTTGAFSVIDLEPNGFSDKMEQNVVEDNYMDFTNVAPGAAIYGVLAQAAGSSNVNSVFIRRNTMIGRPVYSTNNLSGLVGAVRAYGFEGVEVSDNYVRGSIGRAFTIENSRYVKVKGNRCLFCVDGNPTVNAGILMTAVAEGIVSDNELVPGYGNGGTDRIVENEFEVPIQNASGTAFYKVGGGHFQFYDWAARPLSFGSGSGQKVLINNNLYAITAVDAFNPAFNQTVSVTPSFNFTLGQITISSANTTNGVITTAAAHNLNQGARVILSGASLPGGLNDATTYFAIPVSATSLKLATSLNNALAGTAINLTSAGTGSIYATVQTRFTNNRFIDNLASVIIEPSGSSKIRSIFYDTDATPVVKTTTTPAPATTATLTNWTQAAGTTVTGSAPVQASAVPARAIDGNRSSQSDPYANTFVATGQSATTPVELVVDFGQNRSVSEIDLFSLANEVYYTRTPDFVETSAYSVRDFTIDYWNGTAWVNLQTVASNNKAALKYTFAAVNASKIRVRVTASNHSNTFIAELEALGTP